MRGPRQPDAVLNRALGGAVSHDPLMRAALPLGTVTFLFTDVEGSTRLLEELGPDGYAAALAEHRRIVREACVSLGGVEVDTQGDAFLLAFSRAPDALQAATLITERLQEEPIRVRMGLHTGTPLVTDEGYVGAVSSRLEAAGVRLVSLVGPGGTGKTRLALQAAAEASDSYPDGVFWAPLAPLRDPALVLPTVAAALSIGEGKDGSAVDDLARGLAGRRLLVFIDNVEHLLPDAAASVDALLAACPTVTVVVTSRERLQTPGERVYAVPPMSESDGEALFRSRAADAGVELRASTELRTLCEHLDNLPLALELAAARTV